MTFQSVSSNIVKNNGKKMNEVQREDFQIA